MLLVSETNSSHYPLNPIYAFIHLSIYAFYKKRPSSNIIEPGSIVIGLKKENYLSLREMRCLNKYF